MPYLIDGDNLLWAWDFEGEIEEGRGLLLKILLKFQRKKRAKFIVFFDGPIKEIIPLTESIRVIVSATGVPADEMIKETLDSQPDCRGFILVSSDRELKSRAKVKKARVIPSQEFIKIIQRIVKKQEREIREHEVTPLEMRLWENLFRRRDFPDKGLRNFSIKEKNAKK